MMLADTVSSTKIAKRKGKFDFESGRGGRGDGMGRGIEIGDWKLGVGTTGVARWEFLTNPANLFKEDKRRLTVAMGKLAVKY